jgi:hypothetical protein
MEHKAKEIKPHFAELVDAVHKVLKKKGIDGVEVSEMHFRPMDDSRCGPGMVWDCRPVGTTGVKCGCFPI